MNIKQIKELLTSVTTEILGTSEIVTENLTNVVDIGEAILNATSYDNYVKSLINHIGKVMFVDRKYNGSAPSVFRDSWEYGAILEKVSFEMPEATDNDAWALVDGQSYSEVEHKFYKPNVTVKFYSDRTTYNIPISITERQVKESFSNVAQLNGFISGIFTSIENAITIKNDALVMRTINNMIGETLYNADATGKYGNNSFTRAVNLLKLYNDKFNKTLTSADCLNDMEFIKFASYIISLYKYRMSKMSKLFNVGGKDRFTPEERLHTVLLSDFSKSADIYLQSSTFHNELTELPNYESIPYWQGSGTNYSFASVSNIHVNTASNNEINASGILGVMFDEYALGVTNFERWVTSKYTASADFTNYWFKVDAGYFNDLNENFVVFYVADAVAGA